MFHLVILLHVQVPAIVSSSCMLGCVLGAQVPAYFDLIAFVLPSNSFDCFGFDSRENLHV